MHLPYPILSMPSMSHITKIDVMKPAITLSSLDADRLHALLETLPKHCPELEALEEELLRAEIVAPEQMPPHIVTMNSTVRFRLEDGSELCLTLVYPKDMTDTGETISVLAPVGSALLGLSQGDSMEWPRPGGGLLRVQIIEITYQPEREGTFYR